MDTWASSSAEPNIHLPSKHWSNERQRATSLNNSLRSVSPRCGLWISNIYIPREVVRMWVLSWSHNLCSLTPHEEPRTPCQEAFWTTLMGAILPETLTAQTKRDNFISRTHTMLSLRRAFTLQDGLKGGQDFVTHTDPPTTHVCFVSQ